ncbi:2-succinyl-5-enolpyruvyl-6-hydroxy-3-cyclohexene-1-carboxylic-acid synthase [Microvirga sp. STR05]|uniref:2-succinyl-5-enolpyruvyl-6-hydroxy-3-cyclohexene-1-carboxylate synthase n=1 Tax=Hymenobacter duratus TaxID=2771356 RepID=A0ABR8JI08_9BACT|nr:2-succinyl-5-enolpyruvyl-6-hydroxy-3-cyclohexene-1-carboxylic-acid synthase [Hymenobacter duratus]MBD2716479.1 2-succinyl-5-enolpyruvyl-6-hydroxy-3-cyclohexene-1-carboxylic-acid synthase [Hymenobacter duratus]MBR7951394.1 2-succinyl-5-enolpyruvyl-6-hydroxy-3-cyclohexene-1-carboxylic-acid synthase [Microvirga sp. STR05]
MSLQAIHNIPKICAQLGITDVVLSPGSRCAPLTIAFARHPGIQVRTVPDERAAAFIGLGLAQAQRRAVALVCTSGTAGLNYAPAVAEAYFQQIPLVIFTADRPPEWVDQLDGQTIRQADLYGAHAKGSFQFPADTSHTDAQWHAGRIVSEAIGLAEQFPAGPVQINVPLREPFYPKPGEELRFEAVKVTRELPGRPQLPATVLAELRDAIRSTSRVLLVAGQHPADTELLLALHRFAAAFQVPVVGDLIANLHLPAAPDYDQRLRPLGRQDVFMAVPEPGLKEALKPELLITFGQSLISKALKLYLRGARPAQHWHIQPAGPVADTFQSLTKVVRMEPMDFFAALTDTSGTADSMGASEGLGSISGAATAPTGSIPIITTPNHTAAQDATRVARPPAPAGTLRLVWPGSGGQLNDTEALAKAAYLKPWLAAENWATGFLQDFMRQPQQPFNEFTAIYHALQQLPDRTALHLANSMAVRYANILGVPAGRFVEVFANRGTSGIDGCTSTAVGTALAQPGRPVVLFTGDVAFFYDRNAFWHNYATPNLRVVLLNNHAGGIFRLIDGPRQQPELEDFFETRQPLTAANTARDFGLQYFAVSTFAELELALPVFFAPESGASLLEITTDSKTNAEFFEQYRAAVKSSFA